MAIPSIIKDEIRKDDTITSEFRKLIEEILTMQDIADKDMDAAATDVSIRRSLENVYAKDEKLVRFCETY